MTSAHILGALIWALAGWAAFGHHAPSGWEYPSMCCNELDCRVVHIDRVQVTQEGYFLPDYGDGGTLVPFASANSSPDGEYHACIREWATMDFPEIRELNRAVPSYRGRMNRSPICFWAPEHGS